MRRYIDYKNSESAWIGEVPAHWDIRRLKDTLRIPLSYGVSESATDSNPANPRFIRITDFSDNGTLKDETFKSLPSHIADNYLLQDGDILFARSGATVGKTFQFRHHYGKACFAGYLIRARVDESILLSDFLSYFTKSSTYDNWKRASLIKSTIENISAEKYGFHLFVPVPPLPEQQAIADYLDAKTAQIDRKIDLLTQKAAQYRQLKQALINAAVTRGLDQSAPMKDSGVEWIGEVPAHWGFKRLKDAADLRYSNVDKLSQEGEAPVVLCNYVDVYKNDFIDASLPFMAATANATEIKRFSLRKHDVLVTKDSETADDIAVSALVLDTLPGVLCGYHLAQLRGKPEIMYGPYLFRLFQSDNYGHRFATHAKGITRVGLSMSAFADALTPIPPFDEQIAISEHIGAKSAQIDSIVSNIGAQIDKLKDLRKALINAVVTGKLRVT
jgi:type I restriction enzyme S subunit